MGGDTDPSNPLGEVVWGNILEKMAQKPPSAWWHTRLCFASTTALGCHQALPCGLFNT